MSWPRPYALIVNTDNHDKPGLHWVAVYLNNYGEAIYFDSYGVPPLVNSHHQRIRKNAKKYSWNTKRLQSFNSTVCGQYCVMFLYYMSHGYSLENFCNLFSDNYKYNDNLARKFYGKISKSKMHRYNKNQNYVLNGNGRNCKRLCIQSCRPKFSVLC